MSISSPTSARHASDRGPYFGWRIIAALFVCTFTVFGVSIYSFIIFSQPLAKEFDWNPAETGSLVSAMWLVAPLALFAGALGRFRHPWRLIAAGLLIQALVLAAMTFVSEFWQLYALRIVMGFGKVTAVAAAPFIVSRWFSRRFATAMALVWAGGSAGGIVLSPVTEALATSLDWRNASYVIAAGVVIAALVVALLARGPSSPAEVGLAQDGDVLGSETEAPVRQEQAIPSNTIGGLKHINLMVAFIMFIAIVGDGMLSISVLSQQPYFLEQAGISPSNAALVLGLTSAGCFLGAASIGWLLDRLRGIWSSLLIIIMIAIGLLVLAVLGSAPTLLVSIIGGMCLGYGVGAAEVLWLTFVKRQFGEALFPITYGGWYFAMQIGYALGGGVGGLGLQEFGAMGFLVLVGAMYLPAAMSSLVLRAARRTPQD